VQVNESAIGHFHTFLRRFNMYPDDAQISRVFTRDVGTTVEDQTFSITTDFEVVVEVEAGTTIFNNQVVYSIGVAVIDYSLNATDIPNIAPGTAANPNTGFLSNDISLAPWSTQAAQIPFTVHTADLANRVDHMCQAYAFLRAGGGKEPQVSFAVSPFFILIA
jgi:hypothetical protein